MSYLLVMSCVAIIRKLGSKVTRFNKGQAGIVEEPREKFSEFTRKSLDTKDAGDDKWRENMKCRYIDKDSVMKSLFFLKISYELIYT